MDSAAAAAASSFLRAPSAAVATRWIPSAKWSTPAMSAVGMEMRGATGAGGVADTPGKRDAVLGCGSFDRTRESTPSGSTTRTRAAISRTGDATCCIASLVASATTRKRFAMPSATMVACRSLSGIEPADSAAPPNSLAMRPAALEASPARLSSAPAKPVAFTICPATCLTPLATAFARSLTSRAFSCARWKPSTYFLRFPSCSSYRRTVTSSRRLSAIRSYPSSMRPPRPLHAHPAAR